MEYHCRKKFHSDIHCPEWPRIAHARVRIAPFYKANTLTCVRQKKATNLKHTEKKKRRQEKER